MKDLIFVNGTMGVGKTTICQKLKQKLKNCVFLDGDWCWDMNPFVVNSQTKEMVLENISFLLSNFLKCTAYETVLFCWVMQDESIIQDVLSRITTNYDHFSCYTLICSEEQLLQQLRQDIQNGLRKEDVIQRSLERLPMYQTMQTTHLDITGMTAEQAANWLQDHIGK